MKYKRKCTKITTVNLIVVILYIGMYSCLILNILISNIVNRVL